jgi:hypothetical protein
MFSSWMALSLLIYLDMITEEQMCFFLDQEQICWFNKHLTTHGLSHIPQEPMLCFTNIGKDGFEPTTSATKEDLFDVNTSGDPLLIICEILRKRVNRTVRQVCSEYTLFADHLLSSGWDILPGHIDGEHVKISMEGHIVIFINQQGEVASLTKII